MGALIDIEWEGCELLIRDHDCDLWMIMVRSMGVQDSDRGDFKWRRAI